MRAAQELVGRLHDEYMHWQNQLTVESEELKILPVKATLAAACLTYLPSETEESRKCEIICIILNNIKIIFKKYYIFRSIWDKWLTILNTDGLENFSLVKFLSSEQELLQWNSNKLPSDKLSIENAIFLIKVSTFIH